MDAFELLRRDHSQVRAAFAQLGRHLGADADQLLELFHDLERQIRVHECLERHVIFPTSRQRESFRMLVHDSEKKHDEIELKMTELEGSSPDDPKWLRSLLEFEDMVERLFSSEEATLHQRLEETLTPEQRADLSHKVTLVRIGLMQAAEDEEHQVHLARAA